LEGGEEGGRLEGGERGDGRILKKEHHSLSQSTRIDKTQQE
jgi:hypothetical protein